MEYLTLALFTLAISILQGLGQEIARDLKKLFIRYFRKEKPEAGQHG